MELIPIVLLNILKFCIKIGLVNVNARPFKNSNDLIHNCTLLHFAACCGCDNVVKMLLENGTDVNAINGMNETPLQFSVENNEEDDEEIFLEIVKILCKNGADVNAKNDQDCSPVEIALQHGDYRLLHHLIPYKASIPIWG